MLRKYILLTSIFCSSLLAANAQQTEWFTINQAYKSGIELFQKAKYAAASEQFSKVEQSRTSPSSQSLADNKQISLLKENAQYYQAVCALELGNTNAEGLFLAFIREYPSSANTKSAYFQMGKSFFARKNYEKAIEWFTKTSAANLAGKENDEYRFKLAYSYFSTKRYNDAEPLFAKLKDEKGDYNESSIYYYAYLNYLSADYKTALREFERLKNSTAYQASYPYYISALYFLDKRYDDVLAYTIPAIDVIDAQYKPEMYRIVAATYFARSDYKTSLDYYLKFQALDAGKTQNNQDNYQLGYIYMQLNNPQKAIKELEKMGSPDVHYQNGMIVLGQAFIKTNNKQSARNAFFRASRLDFDPKLKEEGLLNYAKLSYELDFYSVALDAVQQFIKTYPRSAKINEAKTLLGEVLLSTKNYKEAVNILETIQNKNEETKAVYQKVTYFRGLEFYNERAFENSISLFMRSQNNAIDDELHALATYWLAEAMFEVRKYGESVAQFEKFLAMPAARKTDVYNFANYALGYSAFQHESYSKAANYFARFLGGDDKDKNTVNDATLRLGDSYFVLKNYGSALQQYNKVIAWNSDGKDYALFQRGMIEGLQGQNDAKIATHQSLLQQFPNSNYADDAGFEIAYTYFVKGDNARSKTDLEGLIEKYPRSSYVPRALVTIGLVQYNQDDDAGALATFQRVVKDYSTTDEAKLALESIKNIYLDKADANGFLAYANTTSIGNLSTSEQDNITFQAANNLFLRGDYQAAFDAVNAYFDKFPKPIYEKHAKFIRAESLVKLNRPDEAIPDYTFILNDWTSEYTERALISISKLYLQQKKYNEAVVYLKKLELTSEYKANYGFAVNNLMEAYSSMNMPDDVLKYVKLVREFNRSSEEDKSRAGLYAGKAYLAKGDTTAGLKELTDVAAKTTTVTGAEAKYLVAYLQYQSGDYKASQKTIFELVKMESHDYWVTKGFILLADNYVALKDIFQAKSTLQSVIDNYEGKDEIIPTAKEKLDQLNKKK
ncbi:tetratricopeptide repeat protein [Arcticibacter tournemirensis]|uniref:Tetratricopeptide repeat protein n=1 Tax=Arcticibacter tournemirensis TaxID=699437 RepID=A0A4Q0MBN8_9SPHI|nr:tetratricopeptide repeat protein [Arcticibacter tournemirensis]KAA8483314.1 tetratricopeptide repeat protein [Arcticibacter tournemirensis]RXF70738.1 tetratricopeptide repeat protein [Arcticibacter tournemirensis]TQM50999.1 tetratricopeptide repeat protein [Arcticibacter tournemirensis]